MIDLRDHLVASRLAGAVATSPGETRRNCGRLIDGWVDYTFGLSDHLDAGTDEAEDAVRATCGTAAVDGEPDGTGWIDPDTTLAGIERHRRGLAEHAGRGSRVVVATGHPTGLLGHYIRIADALGTAGCQVLTPLDDEWLIEDADGHLGLRYLRGVGCVFDGGSLRHTHRSNFMEAALRHLEEEGRRPDLVVADHGMAGAAVEHGIATLWIADVNDPALPLAAARGRTDGGLVIDDNLAPRLFEPVTDAMLADLPG